MGPIDSGKIIRKENCFEVEALSLCGLVFLRTDGVLAIFFKTGLEEIGTCGRAKLMFFFCR